MYTRDEFVRSAARGAAIYKRRTRILAAFAVIVGLGQLPMMRVIDNNFERFTAKHIELAIFLVYFGIVVAMIVLLTRAMSKAAPICGACGVRLTGVAERIAIATGKCDRCGAQVIV